MHSVKLRSFFHLFRQKYLLSLTLSNIFCHSTVGVSVSSLKKKWRSRCKSQIVGTGKSYSIWMQTKPGSKN